MQERDGHTFRIAYASRKLLDRERAYSVVEMECLALIYGVHKFQQYLYGRPFVLETDHQPLIWLNKAKVANARIIWDGRWHYIRIVSNSELSKGPIT